MKMFYDVNDIMQILGLGRSSCYKVINKLQEEFVKDHPNGVVLYKRIPVDYFELKMLGKVRGTNEKN